MTDTNDEPKLSESRARQDVFIVDNASDESRGIAYLHDWCQISSSIDIATGNFEIGALLALEDAWQKLDHLRILIGGATSRSTHDAIVEAQRNLDESFEAARRDDVFLTGMDAIVDALRSGKIEIRVYTRRKFHAKAYITHSSIPVVGSFALVGSSNLSRPGLETNVELNVRFGGAEVSELQEWFERHWDEAEPATPELLTVTERQTVPVTPLEVYGRALQVLTGNLDPADAEWERENSNIYEKLSPYQVDAYHALKAMAARQRGGLLTDGVGLGKTLVGLMLAEYFAERRRLNVLVLATKTGCDAVWEPEIEEYLPELQGEYSRLSLRAHTDLSGIKADPLTERLAKRADVIIVDEAHNFRNRGTAATDEDPNRSRWFRLQEICQDKLVFLLTATPINNGIGDLLHELQLFAGDDDSYFQGQGVPNLRTHLNQIEKQFLAATNEHGDPDADEASSVTMDDFNELLQADPLLPKVIHQSSRKYAIESSLKAGAGEVLFPETAIPAAVDYSLTLESDQLLDELDKAFAKAQPLFTLPMYYPLAYWTGPEDEFNTKLENRQLQVVSLIRTVFLKRFDSSIAAFAGSSVDLAAKIIGWMLANAPDEETRERVLTWRDEHAADFLRIEEDLLKRPKGLPGILEVGATEQASTDDDDDPEDEIAGELGDDFDPDDLDPDRFDLPRMFEESFADLEQIDLLIKSILNVQAGGDEKYRRLAKLLGVSPDSKKSDPDAEFSRDKVLVFSEFADTARYLERRLREDGLKAVECLDGSMSRDRSALIKRFAPFYNKVEDQERENEKPLRVLVSTDVLSEGVNLQDAHLVVNYDLHWNPVRLMQRIGRVDRRRNPDIEKQLLKATGRKKADREAVQIRNFLPTAGVDRLLRLYQRAGQRARLISVTLGIPGGKLFTAEDMLDDTKVFNHYKDERDGDFSPEEELRLEFIDLLAANPGLAERLERMPMRVGTAKSGSPGKKGIFVCSVRPSFLAATDDEEARWTDDPYEPEWAFLTDDGELLRGTGDVHEIADLIRCKPDTAAAAIKDKAQTRKALAEMEDKLADAFIKVNNLPLDTFHGRMVCWMEVG